MSFASMSPDPTSAVALPSSLNGFGDLSQLRSVVSMDLAQLGKKPLLDVELPSTTGIYSASGFDLMAVLARVVTRPNPKIDLGPVDFSCSFVGEQSSLNWK